MTGPISARRIVPAADHEALAAMDTSYETTSVYDVREFPFGFELVPRAVSPGLHRPGGQIVAELAGSPLWSDAWLAVSDGSTAGFAAVGYETWNRRVRLWHLYVDSAHRRRGVGTTLLSTVAHYASSLGASHVFAETSNVNAPAIATYLRYGFGLVGLDTSLYAATSHADEVAVYLALRL
ncbi:GNAT family N-acetyltransferase [Jatrophihabitans sp.]|jgi:ribosomal protein S18 acetylase RimI-like enzyme|uniref:GNAT family N-acetyltransferase n=1 Tax=Jatrophihabitans sp. TaxID=1932789 RepID=UPI002EDE8AB6